MIPIEHQTFLGMMFPMDSDAIRKLLFTITALIGLGLGDLAAGRQLIVSTAPDWNSMRGSMRLFEERSGRWVPVSPFIPVLFGKNGLAWGRGLASGSQPPIFKQEGDGRAPAGLFRLGKVYTPDPALPSGSNYPFHRLGERDAWVDDPKNPLYNRHVVIRDLSNPPHWFAKQQMKVGDFAYRWLVDIRHNRDEIVPGAGSAIFFHIRRGENRPTHGCTTMAAEDLANMIRWLRADRDPRYALLPREEYLRVWRKWSLPPPETAIPRT